MVRRYALTALVLALSVPARGGEMPANWLDACFPTLAAGGDSAPRPEAPARRTTRMTQDKYPLPTHTVEGTGGSQFVPVAYLVNPGPADEPLGRPAISMRYSDLRHRKNLVTVAVSETLFGRVELSYALNRLNLGTLPRESSARLGAGGTFAHHNVHMHNFNVRVLLVEEDAFDLVLPAVTAGVSFKYNDSIRAINNRLGVPLDPLGYERSSGLEFTLHITKKFELDPFELGDVPPVIATVGVRNSEASYIGFLGFTDHRATTVEATFTTFLAEWLAVSYDFRRNQQALSDSAPGAIPPPGLLRGEENWNGIGVALILSENLTIEGGFAWLGNIANTEADGAWGVGVKWEF